jgi:hypothetical protein
MDPQEIIEELEHPGARNLLDSATLLRLAYNGSDGFPRVISRRATSPMAADIQSWPAMTGAVSGRAGAGAEWRAGARCARAWLAVT